MDDSAAHLNVPAELQPFMRAVLRDPTLQSRLGSIAQTDQFVLEMKAIASEQNVPLPDGAFESLIAPDPLGLNMWQSPPVELGEWPAQQWLPVKAIPGQFAPIFDWAWFGDSKTKEPFFEASVRDANRLPLNRMFRTHTSIDALIAGMDDADTVPLSGLIFHMSRCGSTLLGRMLAAPAHHIVVSEPAPLDAVVQWAAVSPAPYEAKIAAVRAVVAALGRRRSADWTRYFVKLDAWHIMSYQLFRDAFPDTPWIFLHRDPVEIMVSQVNMLGMHLIPGALPDAVTQIESMPVTSQDEYSATLLARMAEGAIEHTRGGGGLIVDYADLLPAALAEIPRHFGFTPNAEEAAEMMAVTQNHSKAPATQFAADSDRKQQSADDALRALANSKMRHLHDHLRTLSPISPQK